MLQMHKNVQATYSTEIEGIVVGVTNTCLWATVPRFLPLVLTFPSTLSPPPYFPAKTVDYLIFIFISLGLFLNTHTSSNILHDHILSKMI